MENKNFRPLDLKKKMRLGESVIQTLLFIAGVLSIFMQLHLFMSCKEALLFFNNPDVSLIKFWDHRMATRISMDRPQ
jgi:hypothetical protein